MSTAMHTSVYKTTGHLVQHTHTRHTVVIISEQQAQ